MDTTGQTLSGLAATGYSPYGDDVTRAGMFIAGWQFPNGSLADRTTATAGNSNSTALAAAGLLDMGRDPRDPPYRALGTGGELMSLLDALLAFQEDSGAFMFRLDAPENRLMAVFDTVPALMANYPAYQPACWTNLPLMMK